MKFRFWDTVSLLCAVFCAFLAFYFNYTYNGNSTVFHYGSAQPTLIIDAGHGGEDGGAVSLTGMYESEINLQIAKKVENIAVFCGVPVKMTRDTSQIDYPEKLKTIRARKVYDQKRRVDLINSVNNAVLVSIHQNKFPSKTPSGAEVLYAPTKGSAGFAETIQLLYAEKLNKNSIRTATLISKDIYLLNNISCPGILIECGFLSNPEESYLLENCDYQSKLSVIILSGYMKKFPNTEKTGAYL